MNRIISIAVLALSLGAGPAFADAMSDAQNLKSEYYGTFSIDALNPASVKFETLLTGQQIEFQLNSSPLSTAFTTGMVQNGVTASKPCKRPEASCDNPGLAAANFSQLQVSLNGCNISAAIIALCSVSGSGCTLTSPTSTGATPNLGQGAVMTQPIYLNQMNIATFPTTAACGRLISSSALYLPDQNYTLAFTELGTGSGAGGRLKYDIAVRNKTYSTRGKGK